MTVTYEVHEGYPSWHQQRAGAICAAMTTGFPTREVANDFADKLRERHPTLRVVVYERRIS